MLLRPRLQAQPHYANERAQFDEVRKQGHALVDCLAPPLSFFFALAASFTGVTLESIWLTSTEAGVPMEEVVYVALKIGPPANWEREEAWPADNGHLEGLRVPGVPPFLRGGCVGRAAPGEMR